MTHADGLSGLPSVRLISEKNASDDEDLDNGPQTPKPTMIPAELEVVHSEVPPPEAITETWLYRTPSPRYHQLECKASSSKLKPLPPPLLLSTPLPSSGVSSPEPEAISLPKGIRLCLAMFFCP